MTADVINLEGERFDAKTRGLPSCRDAINAKIREMG